MTGGERDLAHSRQDASPPSLAGDACPFSARRESGDASTVWLDWTQLRAASGHVETVLADWFQTYLMKTNPELGRSGHVCPYMMQSSRLNLLRLTVSDLTIADEAAILALMKSAQALFDTIACQQTKRVFRTVVVAFPACTGAEGIAMLQRVQHALRYRSVIRKSMVGLFEPESGQPGIANRDFKSFKSPIPVIAVRTLVEMDAPFVLRNPPMIPIYLSQFGRSGANRIVEAVKERVTARLARLHA